MPSRSRSTVSPTTPSNQPNTSASSKDKDLLMARAMGRQHSESWAQIDPAVAAARPLAAWRAIGYANAVMSFKHNPLLAELVQEWEKGFDATAETVSPAVGNAPAMESLVGTESNPYYSNQDRAPYELGHLLQQLPADFGLAPVVEMKHVQMASAAGMHAQVAGNTILSGIEAIGNLMEVAGANGDEGASPHMLFCLGDLLRHLAVEGQYLRGVGDSMAFAVSMYGKRDAATSRKEVRHA